MDSFRDKIMRFMQGRYGLDDLGRFLSYVVMAGIIVNILLRSRILNLLVFAGLIYLYYRMMSKNFSRRYEENQKFLNLKYRFQANRNRGFAGQRTDRSSRIFKCPSCGQKVRVPRGKGKISIHCPKCSTDFIKRS